MRGHAGELRLPDFHRMARHAPLVVANAVTDAERLAYGHAARHSPLDPEPLDRLLREPAADRDEAQHGAEQQEQQVVARRNGCNAHRERAQREQPAGTREAEPPPRAEPTSLTQRAYPVGSGARHVRPEAERPR